MYVVLRMRVLVVMLIFLGNLEHGVVLLFMLKHRLYTFGASAQLHPVCSSLPMNFKGSSRSMVIFLFSDTGGQKSDVHVFIDKTIRKKSIRNTYNRILHI